MVDIDYDDKFKVSFSKIRDGSTREKIKKQIIKISDNPEIGKPMRYNRKGTREVYLGSFRLSYSYDNKRDTVIILDFYHKDSQ